MTMDEQGRIQEPQGKDHYYVFLTRNDAPSPLPLPKVVALILRDFEPPKLQTVLKVAFTRGVDPDEYTLLSMSVNLPTGYFEGFIDNVIDLSNIEDLEPKPPADM